MTDAVPLPPPLTDQEVIARAAIIDDLATEGIVYVNHECGACMGEPECAAQEDRRHRIERLAALLASRAPTQQQPGTEHKPDCSFFGPYSEGDDGALFRAPCSCGADPSEGRQSPPAAPPKEGI